MPKSDISPPTPPAPPTTSADFQRVQLYARLNAEVARDPKLRGSVLVVDPTPYADGSSLWHDVVPKLEQMVATRSYDSFSPPLYRITGPLHDLAKSEDKLNALTGGQALNAFRPLMDITGITGVSINTTGNPNSRDYVCLAIGTRGTTPYGEWSEKIFGFYSQFMAPFTPQFKQALNANENNGLTAPQHELGHCINGYNQKPGETAMVTTRRQESIADATEMLLRIRDGEADMLTKMETRGQWRRANSFRTRNFDIKHDTSATLRLLIDDLRQNPELGETMKGLTLTEINTHATAYATRGQLQEFPHLADNNLTAKEKFDRTVLIESEINQASDFVSSSMLLPGDTPMPATLPLNRAVRILQLAHTAEQYLVQPQQSQLAKNVKQLRTQFPDVMRQADQIFADELKRYPPLACAAIHHQSSAVTEPQRTHKLPAAKSRHAPRTHPNHRPITPRIPTR